MNENTIIQILRSPVVLFASAKAKSTWVLFIFEATVTIELDRLKERQWQTITTDTQRLKHLMISFRFAY